MSWVPKRSYRGQRIVNLLRGQAPVVREIRGIKSLCITGGDLMRLLDHLKHEGVMETPGYG
jgi:hypothetical protein